MKHYAGSMLAIILGLAVDLTAGKLGLHWWYLVGIGLVTLVVAWLLRPREEPPTRRPSLVSGNVGKNFRMRDSKVWGADHLVDRSDSSTSMTCPYFVRRARS